MNLVKNFGVLLVALLLVINCSAQNADAASTNFMYSEGKIYVVVAVVVIIVIGLFIYLLNLDRKISKLEKKK